MIAFSAILDGPLSGNKKQWSAIYVHQPDEHVFRRLSPPIEGHALRPIWSPSGIQLAFTAQQSGSGQDFIHIVDTTTWVSHTLPSYGITMKASIWLSETELVCYVGDHEHTALIVTQHDGTSYRSLLDLDIVPQSIQWSPTRQQFITTVLDDPMRLNIVDLVGNVVDHVIITPLPKYEPLWSPDGRAIAFLSDADDTMRLYVLYCAEQEYYYIDAVWYDWKYGPGGFVWSPDSHRIAYVGIAEDHDWRIASLMVANMDGTGRQRVALLNPDDETEELPPITPIWSPNGRQLLYSSVLDDQCHLYVSDFDEQISARLTPSECPFSLIKDLSWGK